MLKTNSKKARQNIREYITANFDGTNYGITTPETFDGIARCIMGTFRKEKFSNEAEKDIITTTNRTPFSIGVPGFHQSLILVITTTDRPLMILAQSLKKPKTKRKSTAKPKRKKCSHG